MLMAIGLSIGGSSAYGNKDIQFVTPEVLHDPCGVSGILLVEGDGMAWSSSSHTPDKLALMPPSEVGEYTTGWATAYANSGVDEVVLGALSRDLSSWGAVEPADGRSFGKYNFQVLDAIVHAFGGKAVLVLSALNPWDHEGHGVPADRQAFSEYVRAVVERYDGDGDFGLPAQDPSYPDIDGSGQVTPADWEASKAEKQAWASAHPVGAYMVEESLPEDPSEYYMTILGDTREEAVKADGDVRIWLPPFPLDRYNKTKLGAWIGPLAEDSVPVEGLARIVVSLAQDSVDFTAQSGMDNLADLWDWLDEFGFLPGKPGGIQLVLGGIRPGYGPPACGLPQCSAQGQSEQLVKTLSLAVTNGVDVIALSGMFGNPVGSEGFDVGILNPEETPPTLDPGAALLNLLAVSGSLLPGGLTQEMFTPVPSTHVVRSEPCEGVTTHVAWYDWTLEVGKDQPYGDLSKAVEIDAEPALSRAFLLDAPDPPSGTVENGIPRAELPPGTASPAATGGTRLVLGRTPLLVVTRTDGWVPDGTGDISEAAGDAPIPDVSEVPVESGGGNGCAAASGPESHYALVLAYLLCLALTFRRFSNP